jgi:hypothetical protein
VSRRVDLRAPGWLGHLLELYLEHHDPAESERAVTAVLCEHPGDDRATLAVRLADRRLGGLRSGPPAVPTALLERLDEGATQQDLARVGVLVAAWDVLMGAALLHENQSPRAERAIEVLTVLALGLEDLPLARRLHEAHLKALEGPVPAGGLDELFRTIERRIEERRRERDLLGGHPIGVVLAHLEVRALAALGSLYFERSAIEEEGVARLHALTRAQKVTLVQVLVALAWADGKVTPAERRLVEHHVELAGLPPAEKKRLLRRLSTPSSADADALELTPLEAGPRRFVLEQAILLSLVDDELDAREQALLEGVAARIGATPLELEQTMVEVAAFYEKNRDAVHDFGPVSGAFGRLRNLVVERAQAAVVTNTRRIVQEIKETGELARLLGVASTRPLTDDEAARVKAQLLDICKTIPALAIFALPGGGLLLPVLLKVLPFNILPTAFSDPPPTSGA